MRRLAPHLGLFTGLHVSNVWLLEDPDRKRFLVDTGHVAERLALRLSLWRAGIRRPGDLAGVLLTHRHSDHAGNAAWLRRTFGCPVICHERDAPFLSGERTPPPMAGRGNALYEELLCRIEDRFPARSPVDEVFGSGPWRHGFDVVPVHGHTEGSVMLHHGPTETLFSGDAILAGFPPLRFIEYLRYAVRGFSADVEACRTAVRAFLDRLPPTETLCSGHGPVARDAGVKLRKLLERSRPAAIPDPLT